MGKLSIIILAGCIAVFWIVFLYKNIVTPIKQELDPQTSVVEDKPVRIQRADGSLKSIVNYKNGQKHGVSYLYYEDGETVMLEMPYRNGERHGTSRKFFRSGELYAETGYIDDKLQGIRKLYYKNGNPKAEIPYWDGYPGTGLVEYLKSGKVKESLTLKFDEARGTIYLSTSGTCSQAEFFIGSLIEEDYFNRYDVEIIALPNTNGTYFIDLNVYTPSYLELQDIICVCKSTQGNPLVLKRRFDSSS